MKIRGINALPGTSYEITEKDAARLSYFLFVFVRALRLRVTDKTGEGIVPFLSFFLFDVSFGFLIFDFPTIARPSSIVDRFAG